MKKTLTLALVMLLTLALSVPTFAGWIPEEAYYDIAFDVQKATAEWNPDGVYTPGEYYDIEMNPAWFSVATQNNSDHEEAQNMENFQLAFSWDENYFYVYAKVNDKNGHDNTFGDNPSGMWTAGMLQICLSDSEHTGTDRLEYGVAITSDTQQLISAVWGDYLSSGFTPVAGEDYFVTLDGDVLTYEARTPVTAFTSIPAEEGAVYGVCIVLSWGNGADYIHTQLAEGCTGNGKDAGAFAQITLTAPEVESAVETEPETEAEVETEPETEAETEAETETEPETVAPVEEEPKVTAPQTLDFVVIPAVAAAVSAIGAAYVASKRRS